jgi:hypothetical protein
MLEELPELGTPDSDSLFPPARCRCHIIKTSKRKSNEIAGWTEATKDAKKT